MKKKYEATKPFTRQGRTVKTGEPLLLSDKEALYLQLQGKVKPVEGKAEGKRLPAPPPEERRVKKTAGKKTEGKEKDK